MSDSDFACPSSCQYAGQPWPRHKPKPTCRLMADYMAAENPVTKASIRQAIRNRMGWMLESRPIKCEPEKPA